MSLLADVADAVARALAVVDHLGPSGGRVGQYLLDVRTDDAALAVLRSAGVGVLSEESGFERPGADEVVVIDPVDGSTNASRGLPWYATSLCLVDRDGPAAALVVNLATGVRYWAERGAGAFCDGTRLRPSACTVPGEAIVGLNGLPPHHLGWAQCRVYGAAALDLCQVAAGVLDAYVDCVPEAHGVWDLAAGALICREAGAVVSDAFGRDLFALDHATRRTPVAAATAALHDAFGRARRSFGDRPG